MNTFGQFINDVVDRKGIFNIRQLRNENSPMINVPLIPMNNKIPQKFSGENI